MASFVQLTVHEVRGFGQFVMRADEGAHGDASGWHFVEEGQIKVAIQGQREGAGDGGGGHDQHVRMRFLRGKFGPLAHAEFVLFVDDHEGGASDSLGSEEQGMRADDDSWPIGIRLFFACRGAQHHGDAERFEKFAQVFVMLVSEHLGGGHECGGMSGGHRTEHGGGGNDGFAAPHVAVEEAVHGVPGGEVVEDAGEDVFLRGGEIEGEGFEEFGEEGALARDDGSLSADLPCTLAGKNALHFEEFLAGEVGAGGFEFLP